MNVEAFYTDQESKKVMSNLLDGTMYSNVVFKTDIFCNC